ncbi:ATP-binding protein, partial [Parapedobacter tibetensis]|uniref:ATP-binding protein n=1 Tax=Parapedobacter tibetensis TaxID=2972951 RepID=UPI00214D1516
MAGEAYMFRCWWSIPVSAWYEVIGEGTIADAILDRLVHGAHRLSLSGECLRKVKK